MKSDKLEKRMVKELRRLKRHLGIQSVPLYKESDMYMKIMSDLKDKFKDPHIFKSDKFNLYRGKVCNEVGVRIANIAFNYKHESIYKKPPIHASFMYNYNMYEYTVYKGFLPIVDRYEYYFTSESAPDKTDKTLGEMVVICMIVELYSALKFTYPNKYRGVKLNEII